MAMSRRLSFNISACCIRVYKSCICIVAKWLLVAFNAVSRPLAWTILFESPETGDTKFRTSCWFEFCVSVSNQWQSDKCQIESYQNQAVLNPENLLTKCLRCPPLSEQDIRLWRNSFTRCWNIISATVYKTVSCCGIYLLIPIRSIENAVGIFAIFAATDIDLIYY